MLVTNNYGHDLNKYFELILTVTSCCYSNQQAGSGGVMLAELAANERAVHGDFFNGKYKERPTTYKHSKSDACMCPFFTYQQLSEQ